jgi:hypothetical protein
MRNREERAMTRKQNRHYKGFMFIDSCIPETPVLLLDPWKNPHGPFKNETQAEQFINSCYHPEKGCWVGIPGEVKK